MNVNPKEAMKATNSTNAFKYKSAFKKISKGISTTPTIIADNKLFQRFAGNGMLAFLWRVAKLTVTIADLANAAPTCLNGAPRIARSSK
jgi:hypothetical protein